MLSPTETTCLCIRSFIATDDVEKPLVGLMGHS